MSEYINYSGSDITNDIVQPNENLLINSDFRSGIINQKGQSSYISIGANRLYTIDRWLFVSDDGSVTINSSSITIKTNQYGYSWFTQKFENQKESSKLLLYIMVKNISGEAIAYLENGSTYENSGLVTLTQGENLIVIDNSKDYNSVGIRVTKNSSIEIEYIKLEKGSYFTGMPVWDGTLELIKCKQYFDVRNIIMVKLPTYIGDIAKESNKFIITNLDNIYDHIKKPTATIVSATSPLNTPVDLTGATLNLGTKGLYHVTLTSNTSYTYLSAVVQFDWYDY